MKNIQKDSEKNNNELAILLEQPEEELLDPNQQQRKDLYKKLKRALGPILPGLCIDLLDLVTFLHIGIFLGLFAGGIAGYWIASEFNLPFKKRMIGSLIAGIYCSLPFTEFIPIGTLVGAYARFHQKFEDESD